MSNKGTNSGRSDEELDALLDAPEEQVVTKPVSNETVDIDSEEIYVPKLNIRRKKKGDNLRPLGSRVPDYIIEDLKLLADYEDVPVEDLVAGILEQVLDDNMDKVYKAVEKQMRNRRKARS